MSSPHARFLNWLNGNLPWNSYLEIGTKHGSTFWAVNANGKTGIDPDPAARHATYRTTSDEYFKRLDDAGFGIHFDLVFVDGLHQREQVVRDVDNSLRYLSAGGVIVMHDCLPKEEHHQTRGDAPPDDRPWCGDAWKAVVDLRQRKDVDVCVLDEDWGYGIVLNRKNTHRANVPESTALTWEWYLRFGKGMLRVVDRSGLIKFLEGYRESHHSGRLQDT